MAEPLKIQVSQDGLYFPLPMKTNVENVVELKNGENAPVLFKIKTSTPDRFTVRPKVGVLHPQASIKVQIICLAASVAAAGLPGGAAKDRFSIETRFVAPEDSLDDVVTAWARKATNSTKPIPPVSKIMLQCNYLAEGTAAPPGIKFTQRPARASSSTPSQNGTMLTPRGGEGLGPLSSDPSVTSGQSVSGEFVPPPIHARAPTNSFDNALNTAGGVAATAAGAIPTIGDTAQSALAQARAAAKQLTSGAPVVPPLKMPVGVPSTSNDIVSPGASSNASVVDRGSRLTSPTAVEARRASAPPQARTRRSGFDRAVGCSLPLWLVIPLMVLSLYVGLHGDELWPWIERSLVVALQFLTTPLMDIPSTTPGATGAAATP